MGDKKLSYITAHTIIKLVEAANIARIQQDEIIDIVATPNGYTLIYFR